ADASPEAASDEWWTWVTLQECAPEDFPENNPTDVDLGSADHDWPERAYTPLSAPSPQDAEAVAAAARRFEACREGTISGPSLLSDRYYFVQHNYVGEGPQDPDWQISQMQIGREVSEAYPVTDPEA